MSKDNFRNRIYRVVVTGFLLYSGVILHAQSNDLKIIGTGKLNYDPLRNDWSMGEVRKLVGEIFLKDPLVIIGKDTLITDMNPVYSQQGNYEITAWNTTRKNKPYKYIFRTLTQSGDRVVYFQIIEPDTKQGIFYMATVK